MLFPENTIWCAFVTLSRLGGFAVDVAGTGSMSLRVRANSIIRSASKVRVLSLESMAAGGRCNCDKGQIRSNKLIKEILFPPCSELIKYYNSKGGFEKNK